MIVLIEYKDEIYNVIGEINDDLKTKYRIYDLDMDYAKVTYVFKHNRGMRNAFSASNLYIYNSERDTGNHKLDNIRNSFNKWKRNKIINEL